MRIAVRIALVVLGLEIAAFGTAPFNRHWPGPEWWWEPRDPLLAYEERERLGPWAHEIVPVPRIGLTIVAGLSLVLGGGLIVRGSWPQWRRAGVSQ